MALGDRTLRRLALVVLVLEVVGVAAGVAFDRVSGRYSDYGFALLLAVFPVVGIIVLRKRPGNTLGWLMLSIGLVFAFPFQDYAEYALVRGHEFAGRVALALAGPTWVPFIGLSGFLLLLFPNGHLPSRRWRWFGWMCGIGLVLCSIVILFSPGPFSEQGHPELTNPLAVPIMSWGLATIVFAPLTVAGGAAAVISRLRHTDDPIERQQLRWLAWAAAIIAISYVFAFVPQALFGTAAQDWGNALGSIAVMTFFLIPVCIGIAILRYRLYDIDVVIRKTVIVAVFAVFIGVVYVAMVAAVGIVIGSRSQDLGTVAVAVGTAIVALAFQPVARWARRLADRIVYGDRANPYEVLAMFGDQLAGTYAADDVVPRIARVLAEGIGASVARVWLLVGDDLRQVASWPPDAGSDVPDDLTVEVQHRGERLGALSVAMPANDPIDPPQEALVRDLAAQVGLVLRNQRLTEQLRARLTDLQAAQKRLVAAQDQERRRLERNIHDGAQQQLVALTVKARLARALTTTDPDRAVGMLSEIETETQTALEDLRDLARGIYPPLLADKGLGAALEAQARKAVVPTDVEASEVGRLPQEIEAAVYFSILEALQNIAKYASASRATVRLDRSDGALTFTVGDDGRGFDAAATGYGTGLQGIADRVGALDGTLSVRSQIGAGTTIVGSVPLDGGEDEVLGDELRKPAERTGAR